MSAEAQFSQPADDVEFPYRAVSRAAVVSVILAFLAAIGLFSDVHADAGHCLGRPVGGVDRAASDQKISAGIWR